MVDGALRGGFACPEAQGPGLAIRSGQFCGDAQAFAESGRQGFRRESVADQFDPECRDRRRSTPRQRDLDGFLFAQCLVEGHRDRWRPSRDRFSVGTDDFHGAGRHRGPAIRVSLKERGQFGLPSSACRRRLGIRGQALHRSREMGFRRLFRPDRLLLEPGALHLHFGRERIFIVKPGQLRDPAVAIIRVDSPLPHVGEEGFQFIEIPRFDRVELVVVAFRAAKRAPKPRCRHGTHPFRSILREVFLGLGPALAGHHVEAIVARRHQLIRGRLGEQIPGQLFPREQVEPFVGVERVDHIIPIWENALVLIPVKPNGVGKPRHVQPPARHAFAKMRTRQKGIDQRFVGPPGGMRGVGQPGEV